MVPRRNWFSSTSKDSHGLNFFGWTPKGRKSKKMKAKVYTSGRAGGDVTKNYGRFTDTYWTTGSMKIRRKK
jgi:hypothetical protein